MQRDIHFVLIIRAYVVTSPYIYINIHKKYMHIYIYIYKQYTNM
jgi:hypothetical protein